MGDEGNDHTCAMLMPVNGSSSCLSAIEPKCRSAVAKIHNDSQQKVMVAKEAACSTKVDPKRN
jgi:hypothetical protein